MHKHILATLCVTLLAAVMVTVGIGQVGIGQEAAETPASPDQAAVERTRKIVRMLDAIYKNAVVLITDKYVHDTDDFPAGSAAVLLFERVSETGSHKVRLLDATGEPYEPNNVARDDFERQGIERLKEGADYYEEVVREDGRPQLRAITPVPVVMQKCVMCHSHYADVAEGQPVGAISYIVPIE